MAAGNSDFNEILSTTLKNYVPKLADNVFTARPLFYALTNGQTIRRINGGAKIVVPMVQIQLLVKLVYIYPILLVIYLILVLIILPAVIVQGTVVVMQY